MALKFRQFRIHLITLISLLHAFSSYSQGAVGIGTNNPDPSAILDVKSTNKGMLIPRVNRAPGATVVSSPVKGLIVFNENTNFNTFEYYDGSGWVQLIPNPTKSNLDMTDKSVTPSVAYKIINLADGTNSGDAVNRGQLDRAVPSGTIVMWYGNLDDLLAEGEWVLCDGNNGTPNLVNRFILGSDGTNGSGGENTHSTRTISYIEEDLYTTAPSNCSRYRYLYSFTTQCVIEEPGGGLSLFTVDYVDIPGNSCTDAASPYVFSDFDTSCSLMSGTCTQKNNPEYYIGNSNCRTGAVERTVVTSTENRPVYYQLAFIMKK